MVSPLRWAPVRRLGPLWGFLGTGPSLPDGSCSCVPPLPCPWASPAREGELLWLVIRARAGEAQAWSQDYPGRQERARSLLGVRASREQGILSIPLDAEAGFPPFSLVPI